MPTPVVSPVRLPSEVVRALSQRSSLRGGVHLAVHLGMLTVSAGALWTLRHTLWAIPLWFSTGVLWNYLYAAQHELSHGTVFASRRANVWWGRAIGLTQLYPRDYDRHHHLRHHRYTGDADHDAELAFRTPYTLWSYLAYLLGPSYWWGRVRAIVACAMRRFDAYPMPPAVAQQLAIEAQVHLLLYGGVVLISLVTGSWLVWWVWLGPLLTLKVAHQLQNTIEHTGRPMVPDLQVSTRTVRAGPVWRWLVWNMTWHTAHHAYPSVPFHRLPQLHRRMVDGGLRAEKSSYLGFQWELLRHLSRGYRV